MLLCSILKILRLISLKIIALKIYNIFNFMCTLLTMADGIIKLKAIIYAEKAKGKEDTIAHRGII